MSVLDDPGPARQRAARGRQLVLERHTSEIRTDRTEALYRTLVDPAAPPRAADR
jgi:hypothetical protein